MRIFAHYILLWMSALLMLSSVFSSCSDDEPFTSDRNAVLTFSTDAVSFDTVFVEITSAMERFCVYNRNGKGVRIASVRLESGGTSGFMMNVDGQSGTAVTGVPILKKDSIFVFVKVRVPVQATSAPTEVTDAIIFTLESGVEQRVTLNVYGQNAMVKKAERISANQTLDNTLPYLIYDSLVVEKDATLTLQEGTSLYFHNGASLIVHGSLKVEGTLEHPVVFRGDRTDKMFTYLPYDRLENQWGGIYLSPTCKGCTINYADIHSGNYGIVCEGMDGEVNIQNTIIHNVAGYGLYLMDCKSLVANTQISNTKYDCVSIYGGTSNFYHCTLAQFYPWKADRGNALYVSNSLDDEEHLVQEANFYNCFVTGYADDEVYGNPGENPFNLHFYHCVLLTDVSDETYFHNCYAESKKADTYKETNFMLFDTHAYLYDFRLVPLSSARGKGSTDYSSLYPTDMNGVSRGETPDAGCYQFQPKE